MNLTKLVTDVYERKARLYPALLLVAPVIVTVAAMLSEQLSRLQSLTAAFVGSGGAFLLTQLSRDSGKAREEALFVLWGGKPSVAVFRHRDSRLDSITKNRYHKKMATLVKGPKSPSPAEEEADPVTADQVYIAWSHYLRVNARENKKQYPAVFQENVSYGYRRNVWGLRPIGIFLSSACLAATAARLWLSWREGASLSAEVLSALAFSFVLLLLWAFRFTTAWVRMPADVYADRLVESIDNLIQKRRQKR